MVDSRAMAQDDDTHSASGAPEGDEGELLEFDLEPDEDADPRDSAENAATAPDATPHPNEEAWKQVRPLRLLVIGGAKGGVGKTVLAANLALYLATIGRRVVLVDADPGGANLHSCLGLSPTVVASRPLRAAKAEDEDHVIPPNALARTPFPGLRLLSAGLDAPGLSAARTPSPARLITGLRKLDADYVVMDLGSGFGRETLDAYLAADTSVFVTVPEPTAIENTYQFLRAAFARALINGIENQEERVGISRRIRAMGGAPAPLDLHELFAREGHPLAPKVLELMRTMRPQIVINQTRLRADLELGFSMQSAVRRRLGITLDYLGHIDNDDTVWACARSRRPLLVESPGTKSSKKIEKLARRLLTHENTKAQAMPQASIPEDTHHDLLEVERGATDDEIRRAFKRARDTYAPQALCCYGLFEPHEIEKLRAKLDEAFDVLLDPSRRRPYEVSVFRSDAEPVRERSLLEEDNEPRPPPPDITPDTQFTGALLKQVRESQGVELRDIARKSRVGLPYLKAIEEDDFDHLPALVYATGFVTEFARFLKLDPHHVSRNYIARYRRYLQDRGKF